MNYQNFKIEELLKDKSFHNWVYQSNTIDMEFWNSYLSANPSQMELLKVASRIIKGIPVFEEKISMGNVHLNWLDLNNAINHRERIRFSQRNKRIIRFPIAAGVLALIFISVFYFIIQFKAPGLYYTIHGVKRNLMLPDRTRVILNPNSLLVYSNFSNKNKSIEVFLEGDAMFSVDQKLKNQTFKFERAFNLIIEDLGTEFTISNKENITDIVVYSGKLKIKIEESEESLMVVSGEKIVLEKNKDIGGKKKSYSKINTV